MLSAEKHFESVIAQFQPLLSRVVASYERQPALQQELLQEVCLAVWQALPSFRGDSQLKTFVLRVAHNRAVDHVNRSVKRIDNVVLDDDLSERLVPDMSLESRAIESQTMSQVLDAIRNLPVAARQVMTLSLEGMSYQEIGEISGLSTSNVGVMLNRAKKQLAKELSNGQV